jgi:hypothetical protein
VVTVLAEPELLAGTVDDVARWVVRALAGRYAITRPDHWESVWWRYDGRRWRPVPAVVPTAAIRYELEHAYFSLLPDKRCNSRRVERLLDPLWIDASLMQVIRRRLRRP